MPRAAGRDRPADPDEPSGPRTPPKPAVDHTSAVGGNLPWPFASDPAQDAEVVGIEIFEAPGETVAPAAAAEPVPAPPADPAPADSAPEDAAPEEAAEPERSGPERPTAAPRRTHGVPQASAAASDEPPRPGSSRPGSRTPVPPRSRTRPPGPSVGPGAGPAGGVRSAYVRPKPADRPAQPATDEVPADEAPAIAAQVPTEAAPVAPRESAPRGPRPSFLVPDPAAQPARHGLRGLLNRFGLSLPPSPAEDEERRSVAALGRAHERPRTIAVVNGKGGSNKTPTTAVLAAVLARYGGAGVLAWDNNETRGTLGWRTEGGAHAGSVRDLLDAADDLLGPAASASDLARFVHHQALDRYDVLRSGGPAGSRLTRAQFDAVHRLARKYYRTVVVDSGNDESADRWQQMVDRADRLVVATTALGEHVESGVLLLEELAARGGHAAELAGSAVMIVSQSDRDRHHGDARRVAAELKRTGIDAVVVPYDRSLHSGRIRFDALGPESKRAWLAATAVVAEV